MKKDVNRMASALLMVAMFGLSGCGPADRTEGGNGTETAIGENAEIIEAPSANAAAEENIAAAQGSAKGAAEPRREEAVPPPAEKESASTEAAKPVEAAAAPATKVPAAPAAPPPTFASCTMCHSTSQGEAHKIGPNLFGVVGSKAGSRPGFAYSEALKNSGTTWSPARLDAFLEAPSATVPGTKMMFPGIKDKQVRQDVVRYLSQLK